MAEPSEVVPDQTNAAHLQITSRKEDCFQDTRDQPAAKAEKARLTVTSAGTTIARL